MGPVVGRRGPEASPTTAWGHFVWTHVGGFAPSETGREAATPLAPGRGEDQPPEGGDPHLILGEFRHVPSPRRLLADPPGQGGLPCRAPQNVTRTLSDGTVRVTLVLNTAEPSSPVSLRASCSR